MLAKLLVCVGITSGVILIVILNTTTPASAGAFGILAVFLCTYLLAASVTTFLVYGASRVVHAIAGVFAARKPVGMLSLRKAYYYSTILAIAPVIIISMQSVGGVGVYELVLIGLLVLIGCIYVTKRVA